MAIDQQLKEKILAATDNGLQIICDLTGLSPADVRGTAEHGFSRKSFRSPFRSDDDKPSASLFKGSKGNWGIKDFATGQWMDCFQFYMHEEHIDNFYLALLELARKYGVEVEGKITPRKAHYEKLTPERIAEIVAQNPEEENHFHLVFKQEYSVSDLAVFNPKVTGNSDAAKEFYNAILEACTYYNLKPVAYYETVKIIKGNATGFRMSSTESYPIFAFDNGTWGKTYEPFASEWQTKDGTAMPPLRFRHYGQKPTRFLYGFEQLEALRHDLREAEYNRLMEEEAEHTTKDNSAAAKAERRKFRKRADKKKLPAVILCTGGSDGVNIKAMGYPAVFSNSETEFILPAEMRELKSYAEEIFYVGDLDKTGIESTHKIGMMYLDVKLIRLPQELAARKSWAAKPCKDVKDFARYYSKSDFAGLLRVAYAYQFWQMRIDQKGQVRGFDVDIVNARHFLQHQGFYRYPNHTNRLQYEMVKQDEHIMSVQDGVSIKNYLEQFVYDTRQEKGVVTAIMKAKIIGEQIIHSLPEWTKPFTKGTKDNQYFFFANQLWNITPSATTAIKPSAANFVTWDKELFLPERNAPEIKTPFFTVTHNGEKYELVMHSQEHPIVQYLINSSRIHWKKEFDKAGVGYYENNAYYAERGLNTLTGKHLTADEQQEQVLHFLSKVAALGYFYHDCKQASKAWLVWCTDNNERDINSSFGRTGKSIFGRCVKELLPTEYFEGRKVDTSTLFHLQNVTEKTRLIWYDDVAQGFTISSMFSSITGPMKIESKFGRAIEIPFAKSSKYLVTSNFNLKDRDPSTTGRLWILAWSDFYHGASNVHPGSKSVRADLNQELFDDWSKELWDGFINLIKDCVTVWLSHGRIDPPMRDIKQQTLRTIMGANFMEWAEEFLIPKVNKRAAGTDEPSKLKAADGDHFIPKKSAEESYAEFLKKRNSRFERADSTAFKMKIQAFVEYNDLILDPPGLKNSRGAIERRATDAMKKEYTLPETTSVLHCYYLLQYVSAAEIQNTPPPIPEGLPFADGDLS